MAKTELQTKPDVEAVSTKTPEKAPALTKETITDKRVEDAADKLSQKMTESASGAKNRFREMSPIGVGKAEALFGKMMAKVQEVKERIKATTEMIKGRSQKGAETGTKTEGALADLQKKFETQSPEEQKATLVKGVELVAAVQAMKDSDEAPQKVEGGRGESERVLLEEKIPIGMRIPVSGFVTLRHAGGFDNQREQFFSDKDLNTYKGSMNTNGGVISFVDRGGKAWVTGDSPEAKKALEDAGYSSNDALKVPLSHGEDLSIHEGDPGIGNNSDKWKRIQDYSRVKREQDYARIAQQQDVEKKKAA